MVKVHPKTNARGNTVAAKLCRLCCCCRFLTCEVCCFKPALLPAKLQLSRETQNPQRRSSQPAPSSKCRTNPSQPANHNWVSESKNGQGLTQTRQARQGLRPNSKKIAASNAASGTVASSTATKIASKSATKLNIHSDTMPKLRLITPKGTSGMPIKRPQQGTGEHHKIRHRRRQGDLLVSRQIGFAPNTSSSNCIFRDCSKSLRTRTQAAENAAHRARVIHALSQKGSRQYSWYTSAVKDGRPRGQPRRLTKPLSRGTRAPREGPPHPDPRLPPPNPLNLFSSFFALFFVFFFFFFYFKPQEEGLL